MLYWLSELNGGEGIFNLFRYITFRAGGAFFTALIFAFLFGKPLIEYLRRVQKKGQPIRDDGPEGHFVKAGTPTMGGILILSALLVGTLMWARLSNGYIWIVLIVTYGYAAIGFADDFAKVSKHKPKCRGASAWRSASGWPSRRRLDDVPASGSDRAAGLSLLPGCAAEPVDPVHRCHDRDRRANAVNLTDGLDGLAIMPVMIAAATFGVITYMVGNANFADYLGLHGVPGRAIVIFVAALIGGGLGFLWYNAPPAAVFMGDTGSLALGGALARLPW